MPAILLIAGIILAVLFLFFDIFYYPLKKFFKNKNILNNLEGLKFDNKLKIKVKKNLF